MAIEKIDAVLYHRMVCTGANALQAQKEDVNRLNVFPVPDGDTGSNMFMTLEAVRTLGTPKGDLGEEAKAVAKAVMRAARGNSGVILSLFFRGVAQSFDGKKEADKEELLAALRNGADSARKAVMKPVEGTILTVMRECANVSISSSDDICTLMDAVYAEAKETLRKTPDMLPALKKAKVVDSGGYGFNIILKGMIKALYGETVEVVEENTSDNTRQSADFSAFSTEEITFQFCTEALVNIEKEIPEEEMGSLRRFLSNLGDSIVLTNDDEIVKVHVHTNEPLKVLTRMFLYGDPQFVKVENMRQQHSNMMSKAEENPEPVEEEAPLDDDYAIIPVANGDGIRDLFMELGASYVIEGGQSMNPSTEDFLKAIREVHCNKVILLPNNSNIVLAAKQAAELCDEGVEVGVVTTKTIPQGVTSIISIDPSLSVAENVENMEAARTTVTTLSVTRAVKDAEIDNISVKKKQYIGLVDNDLKYAADTMEDCIRALAENIIGKDLVTVYYGKKTEEEEAEAVAEIIRSVAENVDVALVSGKQPIYQYIISAE